MLLSKLSRKSRNIRVEVLLAQLQNKYPMNHGSTSSVHRKRLGMENHWMKVTSGEKMRMVRELTPRRNPASRWKASSGRKQGRGLACGCRDSRHVGRAAVLAASTALPSN
ncbi:hypothetical protein AAY473_026735, partial [Plecturocebus cupreus]